MNETMYYIAVGVVVVFVVEASLASSSFGFAFLLGHSIISLYDDSKFCTTTTCLLGAL